MKPGFVCNFYLLWVSNENKQRLKAEALTRKDEDQQAQVQLLSNRFKSVVMTTMSAWGERDNWLQGVRVCFLNLWVFPLELLVLYVWIGWQAGSEGRNWDLPGQTTWMHIEKSLYSMLKINLLRSYLWLKITSEVLYCNTCFFRFFDKTLRNVSSCIYSCRMQKAN